MCGITGIYNISREKAISLQTLVRMNRVLHHRGPDESGIYIDGRIGMGSSRLSIIDLTNGTQPIHNEDKSLWIVYNGEVFNYKPLRKRLADSGHRFYTASDTEVILHLYEEEGPGCLSLLNGQFALAIWDSRKKELFLARDRVGIRPLHYAMRNGCFYFASEIKSLFASDELRCEIDPIALDQVFTFWTTLPKHTAFKDIHELEPGHCLTISENGLVIRKYWDFPVCGREEYLDLSPSEICEGIRPLLLDAVRIRLIADVPVGSYLSGGLDSSGITAIVSRHFNRNVQTFGMRFEEGDFDESTHQHLMVEFLNVAHKELLVRNADIASHFENMIWFCEKPILRTAPVPLYMLSKLVSDNGLKVVLTGEGSDEVFGGYNIFKEALIRSFWARRPDSKMRAGLITRIYPNIFKSSASKRSLIGFFRQGLDSSADPLFSHMIRWNNTGRIKTLFSDDVRNQIGNYDGTDDLRALLPQGFSACGCLSKAQYLESKLFLSNYLLSSQGDRAAMAHSVETRLPYLDYRIIEFMARISPAWKILGLDEKHILKKVFSDLLPPEILKRPKNAYRAPVHQSFAFGNGKSLIETNLSEKAICRTGYFNPRKTEMLLNKFHSRKNMSEVEGMALTGILSTQILHSQYVEGESANRQTGAKPGIIIDRRASLPN